MTKLSDTQAITLSKASQHADGIAAPPASLPPAPRTAVAKARLKAGLLEPTDSTERQHPGHARKLDGEAVFLRITETGLQAIGVEAEAAAEDAQGTPLAALDVGAPDAPPPPLHPPRTRLQARKRALRRRRASTPPHRPRTRPRRRWRPLRAPTGTSAPLPRRPPRRRP